MDNVEDAKKGPAGGSDFSKAMGLLSGSALGQKDPLMRKHAIYMLGLSGNEEYIPTLISAMRDPEKAVRGQAVQSLARIGKPAGRYVLPLLHDKDWRVRYRAAEALGLIGDPGAVNPLILTLPDERDHVRYMAAKSLGLIRDPSAREPLEKCLADDNPFVRSMAASALGGLLPG